MQEESLEVASKLKNLAEIYYAQERYAEAEPLYINALQMIQKILGHEHLDVAMTQWNLGALYHSQKQYADAKAHYLQALTITEAKLGPNHPDTQGIRNSLESLPENI